MSQPNQGHLGRAIFVFLCFSVAMLAVATQAHPTQAEESPPQNTVPALSEHIFLPTIQQDAGEAPRQCEASSDQVYELVLVDGPPTDRIPNQHADLNLTLRGYQPTQAELTLTDINGPIDSFAPQLPGMFADQRTAEFSGAFQVNRWDWGCSALGCADGPILSPEVTMLAVETTVGEVLSLPSRSPEIMEGGFIALVLYAEENRLTLGYTRHDTVAPGYAIHIEDFCVDPNLLSLYQEADAAGRVKLPALKNGHQVGTALTEQVLVAIRDRGSFMDPRSRKDWWQGR